MLYVLYSLIEIVTVLEELIEEIIMDLYIFSLQEDCSAENMIPDQPDNKPFLVSKSSLYLTYKCPLCNCHITIIANIVLKPNTNQGGAA